jgi:hypothetical protein
MCKIILRVGPDSKNFILSKMRSITDLKSYGIMSVEEGSFSTLDNPNENIENCTSRISVGYETFSNLNSYTSKYGNIGVVQTLSEHNLVNIIADDHIFLQSKELNCQPTVSEFYHIFKQSLITSLQKIDFPFFVVVINLDIPQKIFVISSVIDIYLLQDDKSLTVYIDKDLVEQPGFLSTKFTNKILEIDVSDLKVNVEEFCDIQLYDSIRRKDIKFNKNVEYLLERTTDVVIITDNSFYGCSLEAFYLHSNFASSRHFTSNEFDISMISNTENTTVIFMSKNNILLESLFSLDMDDIIVVSHTVESPFFDHSEYKILADSESHTSYYSILLMIAFHNSPEDEKLKSLLDCLTNFKVVAPQKIPQKLCCHIIGKGYYFNLAKGIAENLNKSGYRLIPHSDENMISSFIKDEVIVVQDDILPIECSNILLFPLEVFLMFNKLNI